MLSVSGYGAPTLFRRVCAYLIVCRQLPFWLEGLVYDLLPILPVNARPAIGKCRFPALYSHQCLIRHENSRYNLNTNAPIPSRVTIAPQSLKFESFKRRHHSADSLYVSA